MERSFVILIAVTLIMGLGTGCKKNTEQEKVTITTPEKREEIKIETTENQAKIDETEWNNFKKEIEAQLKADEAMIKELKKEIKVSGKKYDAAYMKTVDTVEKKNTELQNEIHNYDKSQKEWNEFKTRFKNDMDAVDKKLKELKKTDKKK